MNLIQKKILQILGGPVPVTLERNNAAYNPQELAGKSAAVFGFSESLIQEDLKRGLQNCQIKLVSAADLKNQRVNMLLVDLTGFDALGDFDALHTIFNSNISALSRCAKVILIADTSQNTALDALLLGALEGFMRALSKELGRIGATVNLLELGGNRQFMPLLRFLLSARAAFIDAQTFRLSKSDNIGRQSQLLAGKRIVITGAARGIGLALAQTAVREGAVLIGVDVPNNPELKTQMQKLGAKSMELDVSAPDAPTQLCDFLEDHGGAIDGIIHNAGVTRDKTIKRMSGQFWDLVLKINLHAPYHITEYLLQNHLINPNGRIVAMSSIAGIAGNPGQTNYALTKGALAAYMADLAPKLAAKNITANAIAPGFIETEMTAQMPFMVREVGRMFNSLKQGGLPADVAELACFLLSDNSAAITGHNIRICGHNLLGK